MPNVPTHRRLRTVALVALVLLAAPPRGISVAAQQSTGGITTQDLLKGLADPTRWLTFSGDYSGRRHSPLTQITSENVSRLVPRWTFQTDTPGHFETTALVLDGILYATGPNNYAWALDA